MWLSWLLDTLMQLRETGLVGQLCYALLLSAWTLACLPTTPIELAAGFIFPTGPAVVMSVLAKTCASMLGLFLGRQLLRPLPLAPVTEHGCGPRTHAEAPSPRGLGMRIRRSQDIRASVDNITP